MISFSNINKQYGKQLLFVDASFQLNPGEKVGLVGPNGAGKTTLFRMVVGEETPDEGAVSVPKKMTIGYFRQDVEEMQSRSVLDEAIAGSGRVGDLHHELEGGHLRPRPIFSHLAAPSYPSHHLEPVPAKACLGESVLISGHRVMILGPMPLQTIPCSMPVCRY
jgi:hypothetical protein